MRMTRTSAGSRPTPPTFASGEDEATRLQAYHRFFVDIGIGDINGVRLHTQHQKPWSSERFCRRIETLTQRTVEIKSRGWPRSGSGQ
jgi:hypothetical protein